MEVRFLGFGSIEVEGREYEHDIVIDRGAVRKRSKKPSKPYRDTFGHTPLSVAEELVHVAAGLDDGGHHDLEQRVQRQGQCVGAQPPPRPQA
jgi:hypothetical protein